MTSVRVEGADRFAATLAAAGRQLGSLDHTDAGRIIAAAATAAAPRRTGRLAAAHTVTPTPGQVTVSNPTRYAPPVHGGWMGNPGRPWLTTAAADTEAAWSASLETETQTILNTVKGA